MCRILNLCIIMPDDTDPFAIVGASINEWHLASMEIRDAVAEDADTACKVLRRSIVELCAADHRNDPAILERWLGNKAPDIFLTWLNQPDNSVLVAVEDGRMLAVGSVTDEGKIDLNYVLPDTRFRGVSRALLRALEARATERGNARCTLISTETALSFYRARGYSEEGSPIGAFGTMVGYPMAKSLTLQKSSRLCENAISETAGSIDFSVFRDIAVRPS